MQFFLNPLAQGHFQDPGDPTWTRVPVSVEEFLSYLTDAVRRDAVQWKNGDGDVAASWQPWTHLDSELVFIDGHAPFFTHLIVANPWQSILDPLVPITKANRHLLRSGYLHAPHTPEGVLAQWFDRAEVTLEPAAWLVVALLPCQYLLSNAKQEGWAVVAVHTAPTPDVVPPTPSEVVWSTLQCNEPLSTWGYRSSVAFWSKHALAR
jgi:hypothetical protein